MSDLFDLTGKTVLVTGGNGGIGLGFASACARHGANIVIWGRDADKNTQAAESLRSHGNRVEPASVDVTDEVAVDAGMARAVASMGRIDCVFANAGITSHWPNLLEMPSSAYHELLNVGLHGGFHVLRAAGRHMVERAKAGDAGGSLVACGSLTIFRAVPGIGHYAAAKAALAAITRTLAVELAPFGIRANTLAPGLIHTDLVDPAECGPLIESTPMKRIGEVSDLDGLAVYLASDASAFHTGDVLVVDGGAMAVL
jgi:NAD(P)-dependent dehydrogenase (short-subunit alcohol dehydrogenase family)